MKDKANGNWKYRSLFDYKFDQIHNEKSNDNYDGNNSDNSVEMRKIQSSQPLFSRKGKSAGSNTGAEKFQRDSIKFLSAAMPTNFDFTNHQDVM